jgi:dipeptidyl aminopeptidase/acylaminoacyl peptidase
MSAIQTWGRRGASLCPRLARAATVLLSVTGTLQGQAVPQPAFGALPVRVARANWVLADRFGQAALRSVVGSTGVQPHWLGQTDSMWYNWRDRNGTRFYLVVPGTSAKRPLFDHAKLAAALTTTSRKPYDATTLPFTTLNFTKNHKSFRFTVDSSRYEWSLATETLTSLGRPPRDTVPRDEEREEQQLGGRGGGGGGRQGGAGNQDFRNFAPDSTLFVFARNHNLYLVDVSKADTVQITTDGIKDYSFGFRDTTQVQQDDQQQQEDDQQQGGRGDTRSRDPRVRANATWSPDSKAFSIVRSDQRKVKDLYLVNVLADPRPSLSSYKYAMPGEENVAQQELYVWRRGAPGLKQLNIRKWRDQRVMNVHWTVGSDKIRLVRRDRTQRNLDLVEIDVATNSTKTLLTESVENAALEPQNVRYVRPGGDMLWWSERSGWGHYYVYDFNGGYKHPLTSGPWRAEQIVQLDSIRGIVWVAGVGREHGENAYYRHLYRAAADGSSFALVDEGVANHASVLSPTKRYIVDTYSRVDAVPKSVVRDATTGKVVMSLEEMDVARLKEMGWRPPESFVVKAADGVTDIYGNMWKPFDFDSTKRYPIVAQVYPGPQTESVNNTFSATGVPQQLAQLGIIVIQIGNRGGSPQRSLAYHRYGYYNLRDYALADKKSGIEQLAARHPWIDLERVGIYGHSGGGFLTAAALLDPPYNDFFKVGVSSSGNHDNNIYNQNWSESNHGLKVLSQSQTTANGRAIQAGRRGARSPETSAAPDTGFVDDSLRYEIHVPTNIELAPNLKGRLLLVTGDMDNNVHPGNTIRLINALIKANKRFDFMLLPGKPHVYGDMQPYFNRLLMEYFAEHLIGDYYRTGAEIR